MSIRPDRCLKLKSEDAVCNWRQMHAAILFSGSMKEILCFFEIKSKSLATI